MLKRVSSGKIDSTKNVLFFFFLQFQLITVLLLICDSYMRWRARFVSPELCVGVSIFWFHFYQSFYFVQQNQHISQKIKSNVFLNLGNKTVVYERSPPWLATRKVFMVQPVERWEMPSWERNISENEIIQHTQITI